MKRILSLLLLAILITSNGMLVTFAEDEHVHSWYGWEVYEESTCIEKGEEIRYCEDCDAYEYRELPLADHDWSEWYVVSSATVYKAGKKERYCYYCDKETSKSIPKRKLSANHKKAISAVKKYLGAAKKYDYKKMNKCFKSTKSKYGYPTTKYYRKIFKKQNKKMKWKFVDATGKGNTIKVKVKVTTPTYYKPFYNAFYRTCNWMMSHPKASKRSSGNYYTKKLKAYIKKYKVRTTTTTVTFNVVKTKKGWKIKSKSRAVVDIACGFMNKATDDAGDDFVDYYTY